MKFNIMNIVFMMVAIALGSLIGSSVAGMVGFAGGIVGSIVVGFIVYAIWAVISGKKLAIFVGLIFAVMVWLANMIASWIHQATGFGGGLIGLGITAFVLSMLWGYFGGTSTGSKKRRRKKR